MPSDFRFRLSTYITLMMACVCLGYSVWDLLPAAVYFTLPVIALLACMTFIEQRVQLSLFWANVLGFAIAALGFVWVVNEYQKKPDGIATFITQPALALQYLGPLLMVLIPAKLFRAKHVGDWWAMQGIGLACVALGASNTDDIYFPFLAAIYVVLAIWSLSLFFNRRSAGLLPPIVQLSFWTGRPIAVKSQATNSQTTLIAPASDDPIPIRTGVRKHVATIAVLMLVSLPLFLVTPQISQDRWQYGKSLLLIGFQPTAQYDVSTVGELAQNNDLAVEVRAETHEGGPRSDLDEDIYWRGVSYSEYKDEKWSRVEYNGLSNLVSPNIHFQKTVVPDLGPESFVLVYTVQQHIPENVLASPLVWEAGTLAPVQTKFKDDRIDAWDPIYDGSFLPRATPGRTPLRRHLKYQQFYRYPAERNLGDPMSVTAGSWYQLRTVLTTVHLPKVRQYARNLLNDLVNAGKLPREVIDTADTGVDLAIQPRHFEKVALAFNEHFTHSGKFSYTLKLRKQDRKLDTVEDFLLNTQAGHCQRFASALCLLLRSVGVPAQFVLGFHGQDNHGNGYYTINQNHAHAWVEVLIPRPSEKIPGGQAWHWMTLDPTPQTEFMGGGGSWYHWESWSTRIRNFTQLILNYDKSKQEQLGRDIANNWPTIALIVAGVLAMFIAYRLIRGRSATNGSSHGTTATAQTPDWYLEFQELLTRYDLRIASGQTAREFSEAATKVLATVAPDAAEFPAYFTSKLYRVRYAGSALTKSELAEIRAALDKLKRI